MFYPGYGYIKINKGHSLGICLVSYCLGTTIPTWVGAVPAGIKKNPDPGRVKSLKNIP